MAEKLLIMGESGTGKSTSLRNCDPLTTAVVNPVGKPLPFKGSGKFTMLNGETDARKICRWMKEQAAAGKKLLVVDDFQYILAVPYMNRIKETGWDKYNDFGANYFDIIQVCNELPADVVVAYMTHLETLDTGLTTVKLIGKLLREKITIEGLFTVVLRTGVSEGKYYFFTQNSGKDTVKSPMGMFPAYAIDNDMAYVVDKIRNYYEIGEFKSDAEMAVQDSSVAGSVQKPDANGRKSRTRQSASAAPATPVETTAQVQETKGGAANFTSPVQNAVSQSGTAMNPANSGMIAPTFHSEPERKTHDEVKAANDQKIADYYQKQQEAIDAVAGDREEVPWDEVAQAADSVPAPTMDPVPRRTRRERQAAQSEAPAQVPEEVNAAAPVMNPPVSQDAPATDGRVRRTRRTRN